MTFDLTLPADHPQQPPAAGTIGARTPHWTCDVNGNWNLILDNGEWSRNRADLNRKAATAVLEGK